MSNGSDIIIKGGSVDLQFDDQIYQKQNGRHYNSNKRITGVEVKDAQGNVICSVDQSQIQGGNCTITVSCR